MVLHSGGTQREQPSAPVAAAAPHTAPQAFFLERLARLNRKTTLLGRYLVPTDRRLQLLNRALLSTYEDCRALGVGKEAQKIFGNR
jgi:hypothetical protein